MSAFDGLWTDQGARKRRKASPENGHRWSRLYAAAEKFLSGDNRAHSCEKYGVVYALS